MNNQSGPEQDALTQAWSSLDKRTQEVLILRADGFTLDRIGSEYSLTRERIRQIVRSGRTELHNNVLKVDTNYINRIATDFENSLVVHEHDLLRQTSTNASYAMTNLLGYLGYSQVALWGEQVAGWWCRSSGSLNKAVAAILSSAPIEEHELEQIIQANGVPDHFPIQQALRTNRSPLVLTDLGWVRRRAKIADAAHLWLKLRLSPASIEVICDEIKATSGRALAEVLRRNSDTFTQIRPEGTWALRDWKQLNSIYVYQDATEAVVDVVREHGPIALSQLTAETIRRYPVSPWRVNQCIASSLLGIMPDGRIDLEERGARSQVPPEPKRPANIAVSGKKLAIKLPVNAEMLRGSGIGVSLWLTWHLQLHRYPAAMEFDGTFPLTVRRHSSGASISSLRGAIQYLGLSDGCFAVTVLDTADQTCAVIHGCGSACSNGREISL